MISLRIYGTHMSPVNTLVSARYLSSVFILLSFGSQRLRRRGVGLAWQRDEFLVIEVGELHASGSPVRLRLLDPLARRGDEVPLDEALADGLAPEQHDDRALECADERRLARGKHQHLPGVEALILDFDHAGGDIRGALRIFRR